MNNKMSAGKKYVITSLVALALAALPALPANAEAAFSIIGASVVNTGNGQATAAWTTNELSTGAFSINGTVYNDTTLSTFHKVSFKQMRKKVLYCYEFNAINLTGQVANPVMGCLVYQNP